MLPNDALVAADEPNRPPPPDNVDVVVGVPNANDCVDGVPNENPPTPVPPAPADVVLAVPNWNPPVPPVPLADVVLGVPNANMPDILTSASCYNSLQNTLEYSTIPVPVKIKLGLKPSKLVS